MRSALGDTVAVAFRHSSSIGCGNTSNAIEGSCKSNPIDGDNSLVGVRNLKET
jgi:hypothetical protein